MYVGGHSSAAARIYNPRPDPAERGPPKRVNREESHIGERVAASKKRISWTFTLGDADTVHEVVLVHSIMSYKKVIEFDGRQMHFSATATPGDWNFVMILEGNNNVIEVRINDLESADVPKYDLVIDRVPYRRWDVYRRRKQAPGGHPGAQQAPAASFGTQRWGPGGMSAPEPAQAPPPQHRGGAGGGAPYRDQAPSYRSPQMGPQQSRPLPPAAPPKQPKQEIDLLGDFGSDVTVPAQQLLFDPLASTKLGATSMPANPRTSSNPSMAASMAYPHAGNGSRTASNPTLGASPQVPAATPVQNYVDPFANVAQPQPIKPSTSSMNFDPFASAMAPSYSQQGRPQQTTSMAGAPTYPVAGGYPQQPGMGIGMGAPRGVPIAQSYQGRPVTGAPPMQPPSQQAKPGAVNYNISHLMNPMEVNNVRNAQQTKTINIDPFAGMK